MDAVISFFVGIGEAIVSIFDFIVSLFSDIVYLVQLTGKFLLEIPNYFSWLPSSYLSMITILFSIVVLYKILGREG